MALVTGVSRRIGIGSAIARRLLADGASVFASGFEPHDAEMPWETDPGGALEELSRQEGAADRLHHEAADLEEPAAADRLVAATIERFGRIDAHAVSKGAIHQMTASLADALADRGVTVNCINPGPTDTGYATGRSKEAIARMFPAGRWGTPDDVANLVAWLVSDEAAWITGQVLVSEGGFRRWARADGER